MSYYIAFSIENTSGLKIPNTFIKIFKKETKSLRKKIKRLNKLDDIEMTVSQLKELEKLQNELFNFSLKISDSFYITRDEFNENKNFLYWDKKNNTLSLSLEEDTFDFSLENDFFVGDSSIYSSSNNGWVKDVIESLIQEFHCSAIIKDQGDEEYGIEFQDGCNRDLEPAAIWENGMII